VRRKRRRTVNSDKKIPFASALPADHDPPSRILSTTEVRPAIDEKVVRRLFGTARGVRSFISVEVADRMASRLDYLRIDPARVIDCHSNPPANWDFLTARYPKARLTALHMTPAQLAGVGSAAAPGLSRLRRWLGGEVPPGRVCAALDHLPLKPGSVDVVWSNLALHWHPEPHRVFPEWRGALKVGGLVMFTAFGPDTLREVTAAFRQVDRYPHVVPFTDMHDYGDMLVESGFATPVMDMETITLTYATEDSLWEDVRALGGNPLVERRRGLIGRSARARLSAGLDLGRGPDGRLRLSFEVIYGHAWKGVPRTTADGQAIMRRIDPGRSA
jgi:malonyl-CoA O-methyltransferase